MRGREKQTQLKVIKADGSTEQYIHTKVLGTICNALAAAEQADVTEAENIADSVTYYLYHRNTGQTVTSGEILAIIKAVLSSTGYENSAAFLSDHHLRRRIRRTRVEVVSVDIEQLCDTEMLQNKTTDMKSPWNKSVIADSLVAKHGIPRLTARAVAAMVEEKILSMGLNLVPSSLIKQLVLGDAAALLNAQRDLQTV